MDACLSPGAMTSTALLCAEVCECCVPQPKQSLCSVANQGPQYHCVTQENKEKMAECKIVEKLVKFVPVLNDVLLMSVLRLLHNLSFDVSLRDDMVKHGLIPKVSLSAITCAVVLRACQQAASFPGTTTSAKAGKLGLTQLCLRK